MLRKLMICAVVLACSVPSSGCLVVAGAAIYAADKKRDHQRACDAARAAQASDPAVIVPADCKPPKT